MNLKRIIMVKLTDETQKLKSVDRKLITRLEKLGIETVKDLLWHFPFRYEDFRKVVKIGDLEPGQSATVRGIVKKISMRRSWRRRILVIEATIIDETGGITAVWFNQPYIYRILQVGQEANFAGKVTESNKKIYLSNPIYEVLKGTTETKHTAGLIPIYPETKGLTSKGFRYLIKPIFKNLEELKDFIPQEILKKFNFLEINNALRKIHFPRTLNQAQEAKKRFAFEDLFLLQLNNLKIRRELTQQRAPALKISEKELETIIKELPFELTLSQKRSLEEIINDLAKNQPMNRLLQGDVGSGKTVIAAIAAIIAAKNNKQAAFMAPTEVLARQHFKTFNKIFGSLCEKWGIDIGLLLGATTGTEKKKLLINVASGKTQIVLGTHALIQKNVKFNDSALIVIDEQHRFGVKQRAELSARETELMPHFLSMSATPIPRTLSLTIFGDLDLSTIDELPKGRKPILTKIVAPENRNKAYAFIREQIKKGRQVFVICPRIEKQNNEIEISENQSYLKQLKMWDVKAVKEEYEKISKQVFPDLKVAMLHGKLKSTEKEKIMSDFASGQTDLLVSTSVIEVGVDVPNATIMMIEGSDRFGLAQLYQFRGRVGRGEHQSFCFLFTDSSSQTTQERLNAIIQAKNGFELAEKDLAIRGPGQFLGEKQTGIPDLAMKALNNIELVKQARLAAQEIINKSSDFSSYPLLKEKFEGFQKQIHLE